jgi:predicted amidophosphoribosyltransferase
LPLLTSILAQRFRSLREEFRPDVIVPVPTTLVRFLYRGTNLPQALARSLSFRFRVPWMRGLRRSPFGRRQARKSKRDRLRLPPGTFRVRRAHSLRGRSVCLVDDVLTTGGTAAACTAVLLGVGVRSVGILALAHG